MKKIILFFSLFLIHSTSFGQKITFSDIQIYKNTDSLETLLNKQSSNSNLIHLLNLELSYYWSSSFKQGSLIETIEKEGLKSKNVFLLASAKYFKGLQAMKESKMAYAATMIFGALNQFESLQDKSGIIHCAASLSMLNFDGNSKILGNIQPAKYYKDLANSMSKNSNSPKDKIISTFASIIYDYVNQNDKSHQVNFSTAQKIIQNNTQLEICNSKIKVIEAIIFHKKGEFLKSANIYKTLLSNTPITNSNARVTYLFNLGNDYYSMKSYQRAILSYQEALDTFHKSGQAYHLRIIDIFTNLRSVLTINKEYYDANNLADSILKYKEISDYNSQQELLTELQTKYQSEKNSQELSITKKEKALVNANNQLITQKNEALKKYLYLICITLISIIVLLFLTIKQNRKIRQITIDRDNFFTILAHDLRGPIQGFTTIGTSIKFLIKNKRTADVNQMLDNFDLQSKNLAHLTDNMLYWGLLQNFNFKTDLKNENISNHLRDICINFEPILKIKNICLTNEIPANITCKTDIRLVNTIIRNLFDNAIKFNMQNGSIGIKVQNTEELVTIVVQNTGEQIPAQKIILLNNIFAKKATLNIGEKGIGLGTFIIKECNHKLNSSISVRNIDNVINEFTLSISK